MNHRTHRTVQIPRDASPNRDIIINENKPG